MHLLTITMSQRVGGVDAFMQRVGGVDAFMLLMQRAKDHMNRQNLTPDQREAHIRELASSGANLAMLLMKSGAALEATVETAADR